MKSIVASLSFFSLLIFGTYYVTKIDENELQVGDCINGFTLPVIEDGIVYYYKSSLGESFKIKEIKTEYYILTPIFREGEKKPELANWDVYITKEQFKHARFYEFGFINNKMCILRKEK